MQHRANQEPIRRQLIGLADYVHEKQLRDHKVLYLLADQQNNQVHLISQLDLKRRPRQVLQVQFLKLNKKHLASQIREHQVRNVRHQIGSVLEKKVAPYSELHRRVRR